MLRCIVLVTSVLLVAACARAQGSVSLTLEESLGAVERVNVNVLLSREAIVQALEAVNAQRAGLLPTVNFGADQRRSRTVSTTGDELIRQRISDRFDGQLTGSYALFSPQQIARYRAARIGVSVAEFDLQQTTQSILALVAQTYFTHLRNVKRIDVLEANISRARELLRLARNQVDAGVATQIDVTRAESQLAIAEQARLQQDTLVYQSELQLKRLLDLDPAGGLSVADFRVRRIEEELFAEGSSPTHFERRADYLRARQALEQNRAQLRAAKLERLGSVSLTGNYGYVTNEVWESDEFENAWGLGVGVSVPVFDAFRSRTNQRLAFSQVRSQEFRLRQLELLISSELRLASQDARSRYYQVGVAEKSLRLAEEELRLAQRRFEQGVADNREVIDAQNRLAQASDNLNEAIYQYHLSRVELARARGEVRGIVNEKE